MFDFLFKKKVKQGNYKVKRVLQCKGEKVIRQYNSLSEVQRKKGYQRSHISECCNGLRKEAYGYNWKFE